MDFSGFLNPVLPCPDSSLILYAERETGKPGVPGVASGGGFGLTRWPQGPVTWTACALEFPWEGWQQ